jgi:hypothetical protein
MCSAQPASCVGHVAASTAGLNPPCFNDLIVWVKPAFNTHRSRRQWEQEVGQVAGKEVYSVQTIFPSVLTALHLPSHFSVGLRSVGQFCLVSLQADCDSRQRMFQFAVSEVLCILVVCTVVTRFHLPHLNTTEMVSSGSQTCFTIQQTCCSVRVKSSTDRCLRLSSL